MKRKDDVGGWIYDGLVVSLSREEEISSSEDGTNSAEIG